MSDTNIDRNLDEKAATLTATALTHLSQALAEGDSQALRNYLDFCARFHAYSFRNQLLILLQKPEATLVAGFHTWKKMGRHVRKGEKGIAIFVPITQRVRKDRSETNPPRDSRSDRPGKEEEEETLVGFTTGYVFDLDQTEGQPVPELRGASGNPRLYLGKLRALTLIRGIRLDYVPSLSGAKGVSQGGHISILENLSPAEDFLVLCHELAHEMLHKGERRSQTDTRIREMEAESVAYAVGSAIGLQCECSFDYIRLYRGDEKLLCESLTYVQKVSSDILRQIL